MYFSYDDTAYAHVAVAISRDLGFLASPNHLTCSASISGLSAIATSSLFSLEKHSVTFMMFCRKFSLL